MNRELIRDLLNHAQHQAEKQIWFATGIVSAVRLEDRRVRIKILPEEIETNWLRMFMPLAGPDYLIGALPEEGTEVGCLFVGADPNHCYAIGCVFDDDDNPPIVQDKYDLIIKPKAGGWIKIEKDAGITIYTDKDMVAHVSGKVVVNCDNVHLGDETDSSPVLTADSFLPKYNADQALVAAHMNYIAPDATLATIGNATGAAHGAVKVKAH